MRQFEFLSFMPLSVWFKMSSFKFLTQPLRQKKETCSGKITEPSLLNGTRDTARTAQLLSVYHSVRPPFPTIRFPSKCDFSPQFFWQKLCSKMLVKIFFKPKTFWVLQDAGPASATQCVSESFSFSSIPNSDGSTHFSRSKRVQQWIHLLLCLEGAKVQQTTYNLQKKHLFWMSVTQQQAQQLDSRGAFIFFFRTGCCSCPECTKFGICLISSENKTKSSIHEFAIFVFLMGHLFEVTFCWFHSCKTLKDTVTPCSDAERQNIIVSANSSAVLFCSSKTSQKWAKSTIFLLCLFAQGFSDILWHLQTSHFLTGVVSEWIHFRVKRFPSWRNHDGKLVLGS